MVLEAALSLGILYANQGRLKEAEAMYQQALSGFQTVLGPSHWKSQSVMRSLQSLEQAKGTDSGRAILGRIGANAN